MAGPGMNIKTGWELMRRETRLDDPTPVGKYLGCGHQPCQVPRGTMAFRTVATWELMLPADRRTKKEAKSFTSSAECASRDVGTARGIRYDMLGFMEQCVERYLDLANVNIDALRLVATPGLDDRSFGDWHIGFDCL